MTRTVYIVVFDNVEVLDACGPFEVFSVANRVVSRDRPDETEPFRVRAVSASSALNVRARGGLEIVADHTLEDCGKGDILVVPGGVTNVVEKNKTLLAWLKDQRRTAELVASVCNGALILAEAGLLSGRVTTHWDDLEELQRRFPDLDVEDNVRYIAQSATATSAGVSAGIDLSLHLVERYAGINVAETTARIMDYPWSREP